jgi:hypothetical protein
LCVRDEDGELVLVDRLARRLPSRPGRAKITTNRRLLVAVSVGLVSFAIPLAVLAGLRVGGVSRPAYDEFPYPELKVYDPHGHLENAGKPGPFYK